MKNKLLSLLNNGSLISGELLAEQLKVSRTAVWKQINSLRDLGYEIESIKNKGYRLKSRPDIPIPEEITIDLNTKIIGREVYYFKEISSTNLYAKQLVEKHITEGTVVVADIQTKGRGRKNRSWFSPYGGLWFSVVLYPQIPPERGMLVTMTASVAAAQAIKEITSLEPVIKWPNDLLLNGKKICGILSELNAEIDRINYTIVGIGINVNNDIDEDLKDTAVSLKSEIGSRFSRVKLLRSILKHLDENYDRLISGDYRTMQDLWFSYSNITGRKIKVKDEKAVMHGVVSDVDDSGCLILDTKNGSVRIVSGDIEYL